MFRQALVYCHPHQPPPCSVSPAKYGRPVQDFEIHILQHVLPFVGAKPHPNRNTLKPLDLLAEYRLNMHISVCFVFAHKIPSWATIS
jgi:hypothetical protein